MARNRRLRDLAAFIEKVKAVPRSPVLRPKPSSALNSALDAEKGLKEINGKQGRREESPKAGDKKDPRAGLLTVSQGVITAAKLKEKEREKNIERFYTKMGDLRDRITEEKEFRDQNGKKGRREESAVGESDKREQRAGLLTVAPGVLTAAKQKEKDRERNVERSSKIRGERRPGGRLVDTRTSGGRVTAREKERERNKEREREIRSGDKSQADVQVMKGTEEYSSSPTRRQQARRSNGNKEDFPPLPGAREPHSHSATLNYAASALFNPAAPADMDPFDNDSTSGDEYDEDAFTEDGDPDTDEDEAGLDAFYVGDAEEVEVGEPYEGATSWSLDTGHMGSSLGPNRAIPSPVAMQSNGVTASGVFGGLFSNLGSGSSESLFAGYGASMEGSMADLMPTISITQSAACEDDDAADDVVVFRPAFSRINAGPSSNQPPPLSYIGDSPTPTLQPYLMNNRTATSGPSDMGGLSSHSNRRSGPFGLSGPLNPYDDRFESTLPGMRGAESTWHPWDRSSTPTLSCGPEDGSYAPIPMGSMVFNESACYSGMTDQIQGIHSPRNLNATDAWWAKQSSSDVVNNMPNLFNVQNNGLSEPDYVSTRGTRGPPALQQVPSGWSKQGAFPPPAHPPGLVPPPPGFSNVSSNQGGPVNSFQQQQQGQGQGQRDGTGGPWTANPFYRSSG